MRHCTSDQFVTVKEFNDLFTKDPKASLNDDRSSTGINYELIFFYADRQMHNIYRVSQEECARFREGVPYVKVYRCNPKHLCPKLNGYGDNGQRKVWSSGGSTHCTCQLTILSMPVLACGVILRQFSSRLL